MDRQNYDSQDRASIAASRGKNSLLFNKMSITYSHHGRIYHGTNVTRVASLLAAVYSSLACKKVWAAYTVGTLNTSVSYTIILFCV